jgi:hypothetical protein
MGSGYLDWMSSGFSFELTEEDRSKSKEALAPEVSRNDSEREVIRVDEESGSVPTA